MAARMVRDRRQGLHQFHFGRREGRGRIGPEEIDAIDRVRSRRSHKRIDIAGVSNQRAIETPVRFHHILRGVPLIDPGHALKIEVHRIGVRRLFRASRLGGGELGVQRKGQTRDDFVLHVEAIGERLVEALGPAMIAGFGIDELHVDAHAIAAALNATLDDVADVQLTSDRPHV